MTGEPAFTLHGVEPPRHPVLIAVPHAGRRYPAAMARECRLPIARLRVLEDRHADALAETAFARGYSGVVAQVARGWIDLNRDAREYDPGLVEGPAGLAQLPTRKVRGGLGVIPRRIANGGEIWRRRIDAADFAARLGDVHEPYHRAIEMQMSTMAVRFGSAVLIDLHSMPSLPGSRSQAAADIVIGDLFGAAAAPWVSALAGDVARDHRFTPALNAPYAGGFTVARHGQPARDRHAIQIEIDRDHYLDRERLGTGEGLPRVQRFVAALASALSAEIEAQPLPIAAE